MRLRTVCCSSLIALVLVACAGPSTGTVQIALTEWTVQAVPSSAPAGEVGFEVRNEGSVAHEVVLLRTDLAPDELPVAAGVVDVTDPRLTVVAGVKAIGPGTMSGFGARLEAGSYVLICNLPAHYQAGMRTAFTVEG